MTSRPPSERTLLLRILLGFVVLGLGVTFLMTRSSPPKVTPAPQGASEPATTRTADGVVITPARPLAASPAASVAPATIAFARDGKLIVARPDGEIALRDLVGGPKHVLFTHNGNVRDIAVSAGGDAIVFAASDALIVWHRNSASGRTIASGGAVALAFSLDSRTLVSAHSGGEVRVWDAISWTQNATLRPDVGDVRCIAFSSDGRTIALAGNGVALWDLPERRAKRTLAAGDACPAVAFSPDGRLVAIAGASGATLWETTFWQRQATIASGHAVTHVGFWRGGSVVVTASADGSIQLTDLATRGALASLPATAGTIASLALGGDDRTVAVSGAAGTVVWDTATRTARQLDLK